MRFLIQIMQCSSFPKSSFDTEILIVTRNCEGICCVCLQFDSICSRHGSRTDDIFGPFRTLIMVCGNFCHNTTRKRRFLCVIGNA